MDKVQAIPMLYQITGGFARKKGIPKYFVAIQLASTARATYLYGHGTLETRRMGVCCKCGRTLTHPVSVELGIGPECGQHWHNWDLIGGYTKENLERLRGAILDIKIDTWIPKRAIKGTRPSEESVESPTEHPILKPDQERGANGRRLSIVTHYGVECIKIECPYDPEIITLIKSIDGRKSVYEDGRFKYWTCPIKRENLDVLISNGFQQDVDVESFANMADVGETEPADYEEEV